MKIYLAILSLVAVAVTLIIILSEFSLYYAVGVLLTTRLIEEVLTLIELTKK